MHEKTSGHKPQFLILSHAPYSTTMDKKTPPKKNHLFYVVQYNIRLIDCQYGENFTKFCEYVILTIGSEVSMKMKKKIKILIANPAGNITIFVLDHFDRSHYQLIATQLLAMDHLGGEQVAFIAGPDRMDMCGMEFCGNASRAFALMLAKKRGITGDGKVEINVSGCPKPLTVEVDTKNNFTKIEMPPPLAVDHLKAEMLPEDAQLVDMDGIVHVVVKDMAANLDNFNIIKEYIQQQYDPAAIGVMFYDTKASTLAPVVYVKDVASTYFEGSCGSGTTAVAAAFSTGESDGTFSFTLPQPAGTITSTVVKAHGAILSVFIEGTVSLSDIMEVEISL